MIYLGKYELLRQLKYYVVIHGMVTVEPDGNPTGVTGTQLLKLWESPTDKN